MLCNLVSFPLLASNRPVIETQICVTPKYFACKWEWGGRPQVVGNLCIKGLHVSKEYGESKREHPFQYLSILMPQGWHEMTL